MNLIARKLCVSTLLVGICLAAVSCSAIKEADRSIRDITTLTKAQRRQLSAAQRGDIIFETAPYFGEAMVVEKGSRNGKRLPKRVEGPRSLEVQLARPIGIKDAARLITAQTNIPVNIRQRYVLPEGGFVEIPIGGTLKISHQGTLSKFLDLVAARMDVGWSYDGTAITFDRMVTESYRLPIPSHETKFSSFINGITGIGSGQSASLSKTSSQNPWDELEAILKPITPSPSYVQISRNAGRVTIFGPPSVHRKARIILDDYHATYSTRIGLEVAVYFVDAGKVDDFGLDVNLVGKHGSTGSLLRNAGASATNGGLTITRGSSAINFRALATNASVVDYRLASTIAQSGVVSPIVLTRATNYVRTITTTSDTNTTGTNATVTPEVATIDEGISIHALPRLIGRGQIQLSLTLLQNNLIELKPANFGAIQIQLPAVEQRALQNESVLAPGETLILSGYEQELATKTATGTGIAGFFGLGGGAKAQVKKVRMIVFVRPSIIANT